MTELYDRHRCFSGKIVFVNGDQKRPFSFTLTQEMFKTLNEFTNTLQMGHGAGLDPRTLFDYLCSVLFNRRELLECKTEDYHCRTKNFISKR